VYVDGGLDDDVRRYVRDLCLLTSDNDNNATCPVVSSDDVSSFRLNVSTPAMTPCRLPSLAADSSSRCKQPYYVPFCTVNFKKIGKSSNQFFLCRRCFTDHFSGPGSAIGPLCASVCLCECSYDNLRIK